MSCLDLPSLTKMYNWIEEEVMGCGKQQKIGTVEMKEALVWVLDIYISSVIEPWKHEKTLVEG